MLNIKIRVKSEGTRMPSEELIRDIEGDGHNGIRMIPRLKYFFLFLRWFLSGVMFMVFS